MPAGLEALTDPYAHTAREELPGQRDRPRGGPIADSRPQQPSRNDIGLPMGLALHAGDPVIDGENLQCPNPGMVRRIVNNKGGYEARLTRHFAAGEAFAATSLEPGIWIVSLLWPAAPGRFLQ